MGVSSGNVPRIKGPLHRADVSAVNVNANVIDVFYVRSLIRSKWHAILKRVESLVWVARESDSS